MSSEPTAADGKVVIFHYTLTNDAGEVLDTSRDGEPMPYLHGHDNIVIGLERGLAGRKAGDSLTVVVPPEDGYGLSEGPGPQAVPRSAFPEGMAVGPGMQFGAESPDGQTMTLWVTEVLDDEVLVDTNHPLAGVTLTFDVEIVAIRDATSHEVAHGHPHGPDGHHSH
ncbi:MAG: peptidylprolyl isomerase [Myxococcota bacterium]